MNKKINPNANREGAFSSIELPQRVANQLKTLIPVGIAMLWIVTSFD